MIPSNTICNPIVATINPIIRISGFIKLCFTKKFPIRLASNINTRFTNNANKIATIVTNRPYCTGKVTAAVIVAATWRLRAESRRRSVDGTPEGIDADRVVAEMAACPHVKDVHHVHIWAMSTTTNALTAHVVVDDLGAMEQAKADIKARLKEAGIAHSTLEMETPASHCADHGMQYGGGLPRKYGAKAPCRAPHFSTFAPGGPLPRSRRQAPHRPPELPPQAGNGQRRGPFNTAQPSLTLRRAGLSPKALPLQALRATHSQWATSTT